MGKNFQIFSINSKKFKNSISFEFFTHLSSKLPTQIPGTSSGEIGHCLIQVTPHVILFLVYANFLSFHGPFHFLCHPKVCVLAHEDIEGFFVYRAGHMRKNRPKPHTYMVVLQTVTYVATNEDL